MSYKQPKRATMAHIWAAKETSMTELPEKPAPYTSWKHMILDIVGGCKYIVERHTGTVCPVGEEGWIDAPGDDNEMGSSYMPCWQNHRPYSEAHDAPKRAKLTWGALQSELGTATQFEYRVRSSPREDEAVFQRFGTRTPGDKFQVGEYLYTPAEMAEALANLDEDDRLVSLTVTTTKTLLSAP